MNKTSTMTVKGQVTVPLEIRKQLGLKPRQPVHFIERGGKVYIEAQDWQQKLHAAQAKAQTHTSKHNMQPLTDEQLDDAINEAAAQAAIERYAKSE